MKYFFSAFIIPAAFFFLLEVLFWIFRVPVYTGTEQGRSFTGFQHCRFNPEDLEKACRFDNAPGNKIKIFAFGESTVEGFGLPIEKRFTSVLQRELDSKAPGKYLVANFGRSCKDSFYIRDCVKRLSSYKPDYVILYAGHNDYINLFHPKSVGKVFRNYPFLARTLIYLRTHLRLYTVMSHILLPIGKHEPYPFRSSHQFEERHTYLIEQYLENLKEIYHTTTQANGKLLLFTPGSNLREFKTAPRPYTEELFAKLRDRSWKLVDEGNDAFKKGDFDTADTLFRMAKDTDPVPSRVTETFNERLRTFSKEHSNIVLVDFANTLRNRYLKQGIGCNLFGDKKYCDQFHPNEEGHELIADSLAPFFLSTSD